MERDYKQSMLERLTKPSPQPKPQTFSGKSGELDYLVNKMGISAEEALNRVYPPKEDKTEKPKTYPNYTAKSIEDAAKQNKQNPSELALLMKMGIILNGIGL